METKSRNKNRTLRKVFMIAGASLLLGAFFAPNYAMANPAKTVLPIENKVIDFNLDQFKKYLELGTPHQLEGVYSSPDKRYVVAIVKNNDTRHDFIGVVIKAGNAYWKEGEVKFNFVLDESSDKLVGYYYNSEGTPHEVSFCVGGDTLQTDCLKKVELSKI
jgi:hypothetical protein